MKPRGDMAGWDEYGASSAYVPNNVVQLTGGHFLLDNKFGTLGTQEVKDPEYDWSNPVRNTFVSTKREDYPTAEPQNHGYAALYHDKKLSSRLTNVAATLEIPSKWLADTLAVTSRGTFDAQYSAGPGVYGIASKNATQLKDKYGYLSGDAVRQLDEVQRQLEDTPREVLQKGPEFVLTALTLGRKRAEEVAENPRKALVLNNGVYSLNDVFDALGGHAGRSYDHVNNDIRRQSQRAVHVDHRADCRWCRAIAGSNTQPVPHQYQT